ncbi:MAG TPA: condensation domain-containing protein, partial [Streptosporangiaceae bacterium]|nr:condensation domain-containing protein [Streptosporangiaceae bacterium]
MTRPPHPAMSPDSFQVTRSEGQDMSVRNGTHVSTAGTGSLPGETDMLSPAQERLWPGCGGTAVPQAGTIIFQTGGEVDVRCLRQALDWLAVRHASLRTSFAGSDGQPAAAITYDEVSIPLAVTDLPASGLDAEAVGLPPAFSATAVPLARAQLLRRGPGGNTVILAVHPLIADSWSLASLAGELRACYQAAVAGTAPTLPDLPVQYPDFTHWYRNWLAGPAAEKAAEFWRGQLAGAEPPAVPTDRPRLQASWNQTAELACNFRAGLAEDLAQVAERNHVTLTAVLIAAVQVLLHGLSGKRDVTAGLSVPNRVQGGAEDIVGVMGNTIALRAKLPGNPAFREILASAASSLAEGWSRQGIPLERAVPERAAGEPPLYQLAVEVHEDSPAPWTPADAPPVVRYGGPLESDVRLTIWRQGGLLSCRLEYSADLYDEDTVRRLFADGFAAVLEVVAGDADVRLSGVGVLSAGEAQRVVGEW